MLPLLALAAIGILAFGARPNKTSDGELALPPGPSPDKGKEKKEKAKAKEKAREDKHLDKEAKRMTEEKKAKIVKESKEIIHGERDAYSDDDEAEAAAKVAAVEHEKQIAKDKAAADKNSKKVATDQKQKKDDAGAREKKAAADAATTDQPVSTLQRIVLALGAQKSKDLADGKYGPKTEEAWKAAAKKRGLKTTIKRVNGKTAKVDRGAYVALDQAANQATPAPAPVPAPAPAPAPQPTPVLEPQREPAKPNVPPGYDPAKARAGARALANHLRGKGKSNYDRKLTAQWQTWAGLKADKLYGGRTRGALLHYGVKPLDAPAPFYGVDANDKPPFDTIPYTPPDAA